MRLFYALFLLILFIASCQEELAEPLQLGEDQVYFPVELNQKITYDVDSIVLFNTVRGVVYDTARSQVQEELVEAFLGADGDTIYRGQRLWRRNSTDSWQPNQTYTVTKNATRAQLTEDNLTFTKLVFPIRPGVSWDGNAAFNERREFPVGGEFVTIYEFWDYRYAAAPLDTVINGNTLTNTWLVEQADQDLLINLRRAYERYAPGVGLVEQFIDARDTQCVSCCNRDTRICSELPWNEKAEQGFIVHKRLREMH